MQMACGYLLENNSLEARLRNRRQAVLDWENLFTSWYPLPPVVSWNHWFSGKL
jgi:hypothetical protein